MCRSFFKYFCTEKDQITNSPGEKKKKNEIKSHAKLCIINRNLSVLQIQRLQCHENWTEFKSGVSFVSLSSPLGHLSCCGSQLIRAVGLNLVSGNSQSRSKDAADERKRAASRSECVLATRMQCSLLFLPPFLCSSW